jgi:hypothetical protein
MVVAQSNLQEVEAAVAVAVEAVVVVAVGV